MGLVTQAAMAVSKVISKGLGGSSGLPSCSAPTWPSPARKQDVMQMAPSPSPHCPPRLMPPGKGASNRTPTCTHEETWSGVQTLMD